MEYDVSYLGLDIGGAHIKAVGINDNKEIKFVFYEKCEIWNNLSQLNKTLQILLSYIDIKKAIFGITLTAELADCFENRRDGVIRVHDLCKNLNLNFYFFSSKMDFIKNPVSENVASMNWFATACFFKKRIKEAVIVDFGSTTTDLIIIKDGNIQNEHFSDFKRINNLELVYTGFVRTPIFSLTEKITINGEVYNLIPENFSSTADLYRITNKLEKKIDFYDTADKRGKKKSDSLKRISRNFGFDYEKKNECLINLLIKKLIKIQEKKIFYPLSCLMKKKGLNKSTPLIACGIGKDVIRSSATKLGYKTEDMCNFLKGNKKIIGQASMHAPATACAFIISESNN